MSTPPEAAQARQAGPAIGSKSDSVPRPLPTPTAPLLLAAAVVLVSLNLRSPITSVPPLLVTISEDLHLGGAAAGLLTTLPVLCMGLFAPAAQSLAHRIGREAGVTVALLLVLAGTLVRLAGGVAALLYLGALLAGVGIAIAGTLLPGVVKEHFARRSGLATGLYMGGMMASAAVASQLSVPLSHLLGSWQASLSSWSVLTVVALLVWLPVTRHLRAGHVALPAAERAGLPYRSVTAWLLAGYLVGNSWEFYTQVSWIPATYEDLGRSPSSAASMLTIFTVSQAFSGIAAPALADRVRDMRWLLAPAVLITAVGCVGMTLSPGAAPLLWVLLLGLGLGAGFPLGLVLLVVYSASPTAAARLTALVFLISYTAASLGPVVFGALRDATGGTQIPWAVLLAVGLAQLVFVTRLKPDLTKVA